MSLYQWGLLLSIIGFTLATLFAALLMERRVVGSFADWLGELFGLIHARLGRGFPLPRRRIMWMMLLYTIRTAALACSIFLLKHPPHEPVLINAGLMFLLLAAGAIIPLVSLFRQALKDDGGDASAALFGRLLTACMIHELVMLAVSPLVMAGIAILGVTKAVFGFLSYHDDAKKVLVILGTLVAFAGLILQFAASFG
jgi:hypothetical protein